MLVVNTAPVWLLERTYDSDKQAWVHTGFSYRGPLDKEGRPAERVHTSAKEMRRSR